MNISAKRSAATVNESFKRRSGVECAVAALCESSDSWVAACAKQHHEKKVADYLADQAFVVRCKPSVQVVIRVPMIEQEVSVEVAAAELKSLIAA